MKNKFAKVLSFYLSFIGLLSCLPTFLAASDRSADIVNFPSTEYRIGLYQDLVLDVNRITHIIVVGSTNGEDSDQFFQSGISRAIRYKELYPDHQVVIMGSPDVLNTPDDVVFETYSVVVSKKVLEKFTASNMINEIKQFPQIASLDFFGHSSPWAMKIGDMNAAFSPNEHIAALKSLRPNFLPNAYVTLNACNTGFYIASDLSNILRIPVSGALTSSMFERIGADGYWYKEDDWIKGNYVESNKTSFNKTYICMTGACNRMKPSRYNYNSVWGRFKEGGLSFNKFFCNFQNTDNRCEKGMANSLLAFPSVLPITISSTPEDFKRVVFDWLCSTANDRSFFSNCVSGIQDAIARFDLVYQGHPINELMCDFKSCYAKVLCNYSPDGSPIIGTCHVKTPVNPEPTNLAREFLSLTKGFDLLQKGFIKNFK